MLFADVMLVVLTVYVTVLASKRRREDVCAKSLMSAELTLRAVAVAALKAVSSTAEANVCEPATLKVGVAVAVAPLPAPVALRYADFSESIVEVEMSTLIPLNVADAESVDVAGVEPALELFGLSKLHVASYKSPMFAMQKP